MIDFEFEGLTELFATYYGGFRHVSGESSELDHDLLKVDESGDNYMHKSIIHQRTDYFMKLLELKEDIVRRLITTQNNLGQTPLHIAIITGQLEVVKQLVHHKANFASRNNEDETPLHLATKLGKTECLKFLCENVDQTTIDLQNQDGKSALHLAVETQNSNAVDFLTKSGANVNSMNSTTGETALHYAVKDENEQMVARLLQLGGDVNSEEFQGNTPLHALKIGRHRNLASLLLEYGADIYKKNKEGKSPYDLADKTMQRYLQRNRKDRKTRKRRAKDDGATTEDAGRTASTVFAAQDQCYESEPAPRFNSREVDGVPVHGGDLSPLVDWLVTDYIPEPKTGGNLEVLDEGHAVALPSSSCQLLAPTTTDGTIDVTRVVLGSQDAGRISHMHAVESSHQMQPIESPLQQIESVFQPYVFSAAADLESHQISVGNFGTSSKADNGASFAVSTESSSLMACTSNAPMTSAVAPQSTQIDQALSYYGVVCEKDNDTAKKMPTFMASVEEVARHLNISPSYALVKLFSSTDT